MFSGEKIRQYRLANNMTQKELSDKTKIPLRSIQNWEKGVSTPQNIADINAISIALGCYLEDLCDKDKSICHSYKTKEVCNALIRYSQKQTSSSKKQFVFNICKKLEAYV